MRRPVTVALTLLLGLASVPSPAAAPGEPAPAPAARPAAAALGESVVQLAEFVSATLAEVGRVPDWVQVQTAGGAIRALSAAQAFALLARTVYLWETLGDLPETVPITPEEVRPPVVDPEDLPADDFDPETGREVPTQAFLAQAEATVRWVDRLGVVPTAVWVDGQRLSAAEYLGGLAICIQYAYHEGGLYDWVFLPHYAPPPSWLAAAQLAPVVGYEGPEEETMGWWEEGEEPNWLESEEPIAAAAEPQPPRLGVLPEPGATVSGIVDLVASYSGPPAKVVVFSVAGRARAIMDSPPYSYRWNTSGLEPGVHLVGVRVLGDGDLLLANQVSAYIVEPGAATEPADDL